MAVLLDHTETILLVLEEAAEVLVEDLFLFVLARYQTLEL